MAAHAAPPFCTDADRFLLKADTDFRDRFRTLSAPDPPEQTVSDGPLRLAPPATGLLRNRFQDPTSGDYTVAASCAGRLSMKELTEKTARPGPGGP
ncbi:hypothetical protein GCM10010269_05050 [Streptomyces humidus]|uniref:Uncharacterized protein n=1 Tax=Streptomyces humidus TaxID=52259 RepID=A0A918FR27_9ACTN|nr:hypothetical protein GCM10010269_05050 [Streptomyces humidus]